MQKIFISDSKEKKAIIYLLESHIIQSQVDFRYIKLKEIKEEL